MAHVPTSPKSPSIVVVHNPDPKVGIQNSSTAYQIACVYPNMYIYICIPYNCRDPLGKGLRPAKAPFACLTSLSAEDVPKPICSASGAEGAPGQGRHPPKGASTSTVRSLRFQTGSYLLECSSFLGSISEPLRRNYRS